MRILQNTSQGKCSVCGQFICKYDCPIRVALRTKVKKEPVKLTNDQAADLIKALEDNRQEILRLFDAGVGSVALAKDFKTTPAKMSAFLQAHGRVPKRGRKTKK
jgi:hypothetical protein